MVRSLIRWTRIQPVAAPLRSVLSCPPSSWARLWKVPAEQNEPLEGYTPDFLWREQRLVAEADSFATHGTRQAFEDDRRRDQRLARADYRGWSRTPATRRVGRGKSAHI